ncbi:hypothetical protein FSP39_024540 [Pinctada imbricata]|uniref:Cns1/TTC4 wheel domain-containing protein n=1 Tax=Pinctada imbricata TaxID=66713 RepID=A0AA88Y426_PINIB|nr:hypothetical protein FSP39_024540 [Pinctada imbricata]
MTEIDPSKPLNSEMEGLMRLKYETENPIGRAEAYKDDGNNEFKKKRYDIAIDNYTEAIKCKCPDKELNAILYSNRAAAQFHRGNYLSALRDCIMARKFKADHLKAILKGAQCCMEMKKYKDAGQWCDSGLIIEPKNEKFLEMKTKSDKLHRAQERDKRREEMKERKDNEEEKKLLQTIQSRGIRLAGMKQSQKDKKLDPLLLTNLEVHNPSGAKVHADTDGTLHWPVLLLYPEYTQSDYIEDFNEHQSDHINHMFGPAVEAPTWDEDRKYIPASIKVYFEDKEKETLYNLSQDSTLLKALQHER